MTNAAKSRLDLVLLAGLRAGPAYGYVIIEEITRRSSGLFDLSERTVSGAGCTPRQLTGSIAGGPSRSVAPLFHRGVLRRREPVTAPDDPIEVDMVTFARCLAVSLHRRRRVLEEVESHQRDVTDAPVVAGATREEAQPQGHHP